ncbi:MAG: DegT/DnrJ/EryC1/StrS family aminotransferase [Planctomycetota bacterium]
MTTDITPRPVGVGTFSVNPRMRLYLNQVLDSGRISYGEKSLAFEKKFAKLHNCDYAILSNSGTSALEVALQAAKEVNEWEDGDEVLVPATTFVATANIVIHNNLKPVFVDIDGVTYGINSKLAEKALTDKTRAIIPVHLFGQPCEMSNVLLLAEENNLFVVEDSCETMFATHYDQLVGSMGDIGCFSTYVAHLIVTGVGGICTTNNGMYAAKMRSLVNHGLELEFLNPGENFSPGAAVGRRFRFDTMGHSYRITELEAALGLAQLDDLFIHEMLTVRRRNARHLTAGLKILNQAHDDMFYPPITLQHNTHSWMMYPILTKKGHDKEPMMKYLNEHMVETRDMLPILSQPAYSYLDPDDFPVSKWILESGFYVGCHQDLSPEDMQYILQTLGSYLDHHE